MTSDVELLRAWRAGDRRAGGELFARHFDRVRRFFENKVDAHVEDLVQRTFIACIEGRDRFREQSSFRTYLFGIAHNVLCAYIRDKQRGGEVVDLQVLSVVDLGASPTTRLAARGERRLLVEGLRQIPVEDQVILELYYWEDISGPELAVFLGVQLAAARSKLRRARGRLTEAIRRLREEARLVESGSPDLDAWAVELRERTPAH